MDIRDSIAWNQMRSQTLPFLIERPSGPQSRCGRDGEEEKTLSMAGIDAWSSILAHNVHRFLACT